MAAYLWEHSYRVLELGIFVSLCWHPDVFSSALYRFCHNVLVPSVYVFTVICTTVSIGVLTQRTVSVFVLLLGLLQLSGSELWCLVFGDLGRGGKLYMSAMTIFFLWEKIVFFYQALVFLRLHFLWTCHCNFSIVYWCWYLPFVLYGILPQWWNKICSLFPKSYVFIFMYTLILIHK